MIKRPAPRLERRGPLPTGSVAEGPPCVLHACLGGPGSCSQGEQVPAFGLELQSVESGVGAAGANELAMRDGFDHASIVHHMDEIGAQDGGQAVRGHRHRRPADKTDAGHDGVH
jgi:hypothetical protein